MQEMGGKDGIGTKMCLGSMAPLLTRKNLRSPAFLESYHGPLPLTEELKTHAYHDRCVGTDSREPCKDRDLSVGAKRCRDPSSMQRKNLRSVPWKQIEIPWKRIEIAMSASKCTTKDVQQKKEFLAYYALFFGSVFLSINE